MFNFVIIVNNCIKCSLNQTFQLFQDKQVTFKFGNKQTSLSKAVLQNIDVNQYYQNYLIDSTCLSLLQAFSSQRSIQINHQSILH